MNEQEQMSQLSALFDNELPPAEAELVIRRLLKDPASRARWERYALIGACVRDEPIRVSAQQPDVAGRVRRQIASEAERPQAAAQAVVPYPGQRRALSQFARGMVGGAIAAGVAAVALVLVQSMGPAAAPATQMADVVAPAPVASPVQAVQAPVAAPAVVAAADTPPPSITTPVGNSSQPIGGSRGGFMVTHRDVAASGRLLPLSAAVNGYDITQNTVAMTEAEIRAFSLR